MVLIVMSEVTTIITLAGITPLNNQTSDGMIINLNVIYLPNKKEIHEK